MISFIGSGRVGRSFGRYLISKGIKVGGYYDTDKERANQGAEDTNTVSFATAKELIEKSTIIFISTNDDSIKTVAKEINEYTFDKRKIIGHFSGMHSSLILKEILKDKFYCFSLHPLQSFSGESEDLKVLGKSVLTLEGEREALEEIRIILGNTDNQVLEINPEQKILYHGASVMASNYVTTVLYKSIEMLKSLNITNEIAMKMLEPLVEGTVDNVFRKGPEKSLTGPIARGDIETVKEHIRKISAEDSETEEFYKNLGYETVKLASLELLKDEKKIEEFKILFKKGSL